MKFEAVIFDLFGTLIDDFASSAGRMHIEMAAALDVPYEPFMSHWDRTLEMRIVGDFQTVEANLEYVCDLLKLSPRADQIDQAVEIRMKYIKRALQPRPDAMETLSRLKNYGYKMGLLSNCSIEIPMLWPETDFADVIDVPTFSAVARLRKPDTRIYHLACESLAVMPPSCLYIADGEDHELAAATKVGLYPVLIQASSQRTHGASHQEAREWRGAAIGSLPEVLQLVRD
jgi:putative hydrolase of the HAD superfamily